MTRLSVPASDPLRHAPRSWRSDAYDYLRSLGAVPVAYGQGLDDRLRAVAPDGIDAALGSEVDGLRAALEVTRDPARVVTMIYTEEIAALGVHAWTGVAQRRRPCRDARPLCVRRPRRDHPRALSLDRAPPTRIATSAAATAGAGSSSTSERPRTVRP